MLIIFIIRNKLTSSFFNLTNNQSAVQFLEVQILVMAICGKCFDDVRNLTN